MFPGTKYFNTSVDIQFCLKIYLFARIGHILAQESAEQTHFNLCNRFTPDRYK